MRELLSIVGIFAGAAILLFVGLMSSDQAPIRYYAQPIAQQNAAAAETERRGTRDAPIFVQVVSPEKSEYETANEDAERKEKTARERGMVKWTAVAAFAATIAAVIALVQAGFFYRQLNIMAKGVTDAEEVAKAAKASADATLASLEIEHAAQRPYIKMSHTPPGLRFSEGAAPDADWRLIVQISIKNGGHSPGTVSDVVLKATHKGKGLIPTRSVPDSRKKPLGFFIPAEENFFGFGFSIAAVDGRRLQNFGGVTLTGYVDYIDQFGGRWRSGYERLYNSAHDPQNNLVIPWESDGHYDRARKRTDPDPGIDWDWEPKPPPEKAA